MSGMRCLFCGRPTPGRKSNRRKKARRVAILYHGGPEARQNGAPETSKVPKVFPALTALGIDAVPIVYNDDFCTDVRRRLLAVDGVLVWVNPIESGRDRSQLAAPLR